MKWFIVFILIIIITSLGVLSFIEEPQAPEIQSPSNWIQESQIHVYPNQIILDINHASWARFTNTNSMDPFIDEDSHAIEIMPTYPIQIQVGDIIAYQLGDTVVIDRVIERGIDSIGYYYIVKGDNNAVQDPTPVRFEQVRGVVVAVIY